MARRDPVVASVWAPEGATVDVAVRSGGWEATAWRYWRQIGEIHYAVSQVARQVSRVDWIVEINGETRDPAVLNSVVAGTSVEEVSRLAAIHLQVAGELWYVEEAGGWLVVASVASQRAEIVERAVKAGRVAFRLWTPDPTEQAMSDSPVRAVLGPAEELLTLESLSRAQTRSRLVQAGILRVPSELSFPDEEEGLGPRLQAAAEAQIADERSPAAVVPIIVEGKSEDLDGLSLLVFDRPYDDKLDRRVELALRRIAWGLDIPPEIMLGMGDANHWSAWLLQEDTYRGHVEPLAVQVGDLFSTALAKTLELDPDVVSVMPDPTALLARRSSVADAFAAYDRGIVSAAYVREVMGVADEDAADTPPGGTADPVVAVEQPPALVAAVSVNIGSDLVRVDERMRDRLIGALDVAADVARSKVGARLRTLTRSTHDLTAVDNPDVAAYLGAEAGLIVDLEATVRDSLGPLLEAWARIVADGWDSLRALGLPIGPDWSEAYEESTRVLEDTATAWIVGQLSGPRGPAPADIARAAMARAGGSPVVAAFAPTPEDPFGFGVGVLSNRELEALGFTLQTWRWVYGPEHREDPFVPHVDLDGLEGTEFEGPWGGAWPGDHQGCKCSLEPLYDSPS